MSEKAAEVLADDFREVADALLAAHDSGELLTCVQDSPDGFKVCLLFLLDKANESMLPTAMLHYLKLRNAVMGLGCEVLCELRDVIDRMGAAYGPCSGPIFASQLGFGSGLTRVEFHIGAWGWDPCLEYRQDLVIFSVVPSQQRPVSSGVASRV